MKSYELIDTDENVFVSLMQDTISRNSYLYRFVDLIDSLTGNVSIAVNGRWGSGKTFFVKQAKLLLEAENPYFSDREYFSKTNNSGSWITHKNGKNYDHVLPVYYDAWINDNTTDPILSLTYEIINQLGIEDDIQNRPGFKDILKEVISPFVEKFIGVNAEKFMEAIEGEDLLKAVSTQKTVHDLVDDFFENVIRERGNRLIIFIDELDRCRPDYAVNLLERIKHYFSNKNVTYVFSVNLDELQHTIKRFYGEGFSATEYLDRFFDLTIDIPLISVDDYFNSIYFPNNDLVAKICKVVVSKLDFSMRQVERFSRIIKIAIYNNKLYRDGPVWEEQKANYFMMVNIAPLVIGLRMANTTKYKEFIGGKDPSFLHEVYSGEHARLADHYMINKDESFQKNSINYVNYKDRLNEIYNAIFVKMYISETTVDIGQMTFSKGSKEWLFDVVSLFSFQTDFDLS